MFRNQGSRANGHGDRYHNNGKHNPDQQQPFAGLRAALMGEGAPQDELQAIEDQLTQTMTPVEPHPEFVSSLKTQLMSEHSEVMASYDERHERAVQVFGRAVSIFAVTAIVSHIVGSIVVLVTFIVQRSRRGPAAA